MKDHREVWVGGPRLLILAPGVPVWRCVRCNACGQWINGYYLSIRHHMREHRERGEPTAGCTRPPGVGG